jgi:uncharacterized membrane protein
MSHVRRPFGIVVRVVTSRPRLFIGLGCGLVAAFLLPAAATATASTIGAWDIGVGVYLILTLHLFLTEDHRGMARHAAAQQEGEWTIFAVTVGVVVISFVSILEEFAGTSALHGGSKAFHVGLVAATLLLSWLMTQFTFAFRYAHEFYTTSGDGPDVDGGLNFPGENNPDYMDFLYFALVLGMTFQVSDVQITARKLRRLATVQGFLGFMFNTVILALTVNIAAGLL